MFQKNDMGSILVRYHPFFKIPIMIVTLFISGLLVVMLAPKSPGWALVMVGCQALYITHKIILRRGL